MISKSDSLTMTENAFSFLEKCLYVFFRSRSYLFNNRSGNYFLKKPVFEHFFFLSNTALKLTIKREKLNMEVFQLCLRAFELVLKT